VWNSAHFRLLRWNESIRCRNSGRKIDGVLGFSLNGPAIIVMVSNRSALAQRWAPGLMQIDGGRL
jgi:hypothetical protein